MDNPELGHTGEDLEVEKPGKMVGYRNTMEKLSLIWKDTFWPGSSDNFHDDVTWRSQMFIPFLSSKTPTQPSPYTVVLHGPAGVGKTTVAKKCMLDWAKNYSPTVKYAFYLSCKELNHVGACTFAELVSKDWPELKDDIKEVLLAQAQKVLFIVDGFDELRAPPGALISDICGDLEATKPVPVLLSSLLIRKMVPRATLLITTRPRALRELRLLVEQPLFLEIEGLLELDRKAYFLKHFGDEDRALRAFGLMRNNAALFHLGSAPAVCWIVCTCLKQQMEKGEDPSLTCQTTTSLFLRFLCSQFMQAPGSCPGQSLRGPLKALCLLAAEGTWTQTSVFDGEDLERLGVKESDLCPFLDKNVLQKDRDCEGCYSFLHLSVQQFFAAMFYVLENEEEDGDSHRWDIGDVQKLFSKEERLSNPNLTQVRYFFFGLLNEKRAKELETTFGCRISMEIKQELLKCKATSNEEKPVVSLMDTEEVLYCLYESQDEELVKGAMAHFREMSLHLENKTDVIHSSFCLKHCQNLRELTLQVAKGVFLENDTSESAPQFERSQADYYILHHWRNLCSVVSSNRTLSFLDVSQSFLSDSTVRILCDYITRVTCHLQKVVIRNVFPTDAYRDFCLAFIGKKTLTHLTIEGCVQWDEMMLAMLCETLKHPRCNLQYLRLGSSSATSQQWADFSLAFKINQSLMYLDLSDSELLDEGAKVLCATLRHPKCSLQRLSLENCHLTKASCKDFASVLMVNQRLTYLCLAKNDLGDGGVKLLGEGLSCPECKLQTLMLSNCNITKRGCEHILKILQEDSSLTNLDLSLNPIAAGVSFLCEALKDPNCNLRCLGLWGCSITPLCCEDLASALLSNEKLETLDLFQNNLGHSGVTLLFEALKQKNGPLKTLRLKADEYNMKIQKLLKEVKESNPRLTIACNVASTTRSSYCDFLS